MTTLEPPPPHDLDDESGGGRRGLFILGAVAIAALLGGWIYVLFVYDPGLLIDELADREFPEAAERVCAGARDELEQLPPANEAPSASARADVVERTNVIYTRMLDDLEPLLPTEPDNVRRGVAEWLGDWRTYVEDREQYVDDLRADPDARFLETPKASTNRGITRAIDSFAEVNRMDSCTTPGDVS